MSLQVFPFNPIESPLNTHSNQYQPAFHQKICSFSQFFQSRSSRSRRDFVACPVACPPLPLKASLLSPADLHPGRRSRALGLEDGRGGAPRGGDRTTDRWIRWIRWIRWMVMETHGMKGRETMDFTIKYRGIWGGPVNCPCK